MKKLPNLTEIMIGLTEFKKQLTDILSNKQTKVIVKNNEPTSIIMPYEDYVALSNRAEDYQNAIRQAGKSVVMSNGVEMMVVVEVENQTLGTRTFQNLVIKTFIKMKTSGDFKLHHTHSMSAPSVDVTLTTEEIIAEYAKRGNRQ